MGHDVGDFVLQTVAIRLKGCLRKGDRVARLGGDEFVVLAYTDKDTAKNEIKLLGERIIKSINNSIFVREDNIHVGCSIGASFFYENNQDIKHIIKLADNALYKAKNTGKNTIILEDS